MRLSRRHLVASLGWGLAACAVGSRAWSPRGGVGAEASLGESVDGGLVLPDGARVAVWTSGRVGVWTTPTASAPALLVTAAPLIAEAERATFASLIDVVALDASTLLVVSRHRPPAGDSWIDVSALDVTSGALRPVGRPTGDVRRCFVLPDRRTLILGTHVVDAATLQPRLELPLAAWHAAFLPDGRHAAIADHDRLVVVDLQTGAFSVELDASRLGGVDALAAHPGEARVFYTLADQPDVLHVRDVGAGTEAEWPCEPVSSLRGLPDGSVLAVRRTATDENLVRLAPPDGATEVVVELPPSSSTIYATVDPFPARDGRVTQVLLATRTGARLVDLATRATVELPLRYADHVGGGA